jgi:histidine triad (HIT) family protein
MNDCIFCKIAQHQLPSKIEYEDRDFIAFDDIAPKAPVHILVIPKKHLDSVKSLDQKEALLAGKLILIAKKLAQKNKLEGYQIVFNVGKEGGQIIPHIHLHLLGGNRKAIV